MKRRVVITGMGVVTPLSCKVEDLWTRICNGESGIRKVESFDFSQFRSQIGGEVCNWSCDGYLPQKEAKRLDRFAQFAVVAAKDAVDAKVAAVETVAPVAEATEAVEPAAAASETAAE